MSTTWLHALKKLETIQARPLPAALALELAPYPAEVSKNRILAAEISQFFLCLNRHAAPCLECRGCTQVSEQRAGMDWLYLTPQPSIRLEHIQPIFERVGRAPFEAYRYVVYIDTAEELTPQAANALLKLVEEPPLRWTFIFAVSDTQQLLPTLLSRCLKLRVPTGQHGTSELEPAIARLVDAFLENPLSASLLDLAEQMGKSDPVFKAIVGALEQRLMLSSGDISSSPVGLRSKHIATVRRHLETSANRKLLSHHFLLQWTQFK